MNEKKEQYESVMRGIWKFHEYSASCVEDYVKYLESIETNFRDLSSFLDKEHPEILRKFYNVPDPPPDDPVVLCDYCNQNMNAVPGCAIDKVQCDGEVYPRIKYSGVTAPDGTVYRCHDCGCAPGNYHHPGCDDEDCPRCHRQLISCDCEAVWQPTSS